MIIQVGLNCNLLPEARLALPSIQAVQEYRLENLQGWGLRVVAVIFWMVVFLPVEQAHCLWMH